MENENKRASKKIIIKILVVILALLFLVVAFKLAPNYEINDTYAKNKINLILNNNNVTKKLKKDLFINDKNVIYMSREDIKNYFDKYIMVDEDNDQIVTTFGEKIGVLPLNQNIIKINDSTVNVLSGAIKKDDTYYLPISEMSKVYNIEIDYIKNNQILVLSSLNRELIRTDVAKNCSVKYKPTSFSKTIDKL